MEQHCTEGINRKPMVHYPTIQPDTKILTKTTFHALMNNTSRW